MNVSVIIPVYDRAGRIMTAVESVLAQTLTPAEIIIVDDGSAEDQTAPLRELEESRVTAISQENQGPAGARNTGLRAATAEWIAFLDSDDWWLPGKLEAQVRWHQEHPDCLISQTDEIWIRNGRRVNPRKYHAKPQGDIFELSLRRCLVSPSAVLIHRRVFDEVGLFDPALPVCEDYDLWLRIAIRFQVGLVPSQLVVKTGGHADQLSTRFRGMDRWRVRSIEKLLADGGLTAAQRAAAESELARKREILRAGAEKHGKDFEAYMAEIVELNN